MCCPTGTAPGASPHACPSYRSWWRTSDIFSLHSDFEILLEAQDRKGQIVGEAKPGGPVNAATGTVTLKPGQLEQVTVRMNPEYEGKFTLKALNPVTITAYATLDLETDYAV